jgi:hypothetical protein
MSDLADPIDGWPLSEVRSTSTGPASDDLYGKLYYHIRNVMASFRSRLQGHECQLQLYDVNAAELPKYIRDLRFDRIEVCELSEREDGLVEGELLTVH